MGIHDTHSGAQPWDSGISQQVENELQARRSLSMTSTFASNSDSLIKGNTAAVLALLEEQRRTNRMLLAVLRQGLGHAPHAEVAAFDEEMDHNARDLSDNT